MSMEETILIRTIFIYLYLSSIFLITGCWSWETISEPLTQPKEQNIHSDNTAFRKALEANPSDFTAYNAVKNNYRLRLTKLRDQMDEVILERSTAKNQGTEQLQNLQQRWQELVNQKTQYYLEQAEFYLLYQDSSTDIYQNANLSLTDFPEIDAHLRDAYDLLKEIDEGHTPIAEPSIPKETAYQTSSYSAVESNNIANKDLYLASTSDEIELEPTLNTPPQTPPPPKTPTNVNPKLVQIMDMRKTITIKYINTLLHLSQQIETLHSLDLLKEADAQIAKFYRQENPTSEVALLIANNEEASEQVNTLAKQICQDQFKCHCSALEIHHRNRQNFLNMQEFQLAEEELKTMEQLRDSLIQLKIQELWRLQKIKRTDAEKHPEMATVYDAVMPYFKK